MDLYESVIFLEGGGKYRACITENYYNQLVNMNLSYKCIVKDKVEEIPIGNFRKVEDSGV